MNTEMKDKHSQNNEVEKIKEQYVELETKYRALLNVHYPSDDKKKESEGRPSSKFEEDYSETRNTQEFKNRLKKVTIQDVSGLGNKILQLNC